jgi:hypothetical protein
MIKGGAGIGLNRTRDRTDLSEVDGENNRK